jgi:hypothetical protein
LTGPLDEALKTLPRHRAAALTDKNIVVRRRVMSNGQRAKPICRHLSSLICALVGTRSAPVAP